MVEAFTNFFSNRSSDYGGDSKALGNAIRRLGRIRNLSLVGFENPDQAFWMAIGEIPSVISVYIDGCPVDDDAVRTFAFPNLETLAIRQGLITGETLPPMTKLTVADFTDSPITDRGLMNVLASAELQRLTMDDTAITAISATTIANEMSLKHARLRGTAVGAELLKKLHQSRPDLDLGMTAKDALGTGAEERE